MAWDTLGVARVVADAARVEAGRRSKVVERATERGARVDTDARLRAGAPAREPWWRDPSASAAPAAATASTTTTAAKAARRFTTRTVRGGGVARAAPIRAILASMARLILHITTAPEWAAAQEAGEYRAPSLETEGFIHCSTPAQVVHVADWFYRDVPDLVLLCIDPAELTSEVMWESSADAFAGEFPHVYGPIALDAVRAALPWRRGEEGFTVPAKVHLLEDD